MLLSTWVESSRCFFICTPNSSTSARGHRLENVLRRFIFAQQLPVAVQRTRAQILPVAREVGLFPEALRRLDQGMEGVVRRSILELLPAEQLGEHFHAVMGRPTKELYSMSGLFLLEEFRDWTIDQAADAWSFDASVQFLPSRPADQRRPA